MKDRVEIITRTERRRKFSHAEKAAILAETLDAAIGDYLENVRYPSREVNEIDNRGSTFYLTLYWAQALAAQDRDASMKERFARTRKFYGDPDESVWRAGRGKRYADDAYLRAPRKRRK